MQEKRLGRGLRSLLSIEETPVAVEPISLPLEALSPNRMQPRAAFSEESLQALGDSMREHGVLQPIIVRRAAAGFEIVAGERRWRAARLAGLSSVPVRVVEAIDDGRALEIALVENVQREDLDSISKARALRRLVEVFSLTQEQVAHRVGLDRATIANLLRLLELPADLQEMVSRGTLSPGSARALLGVADPGRQRELAARAADEGLPVRDIEALSRRERPPGRTRKVQVSRQNAWARDLEARLVGHLGCRARVSESRRRWKITLECAGEGELTRISDLILGQGAGRTENLA